MAVQFAILLIIAESIRSKPTFGVTSIEGQALPGVGPVPDIMVLGPLARSAEDLATALDVIARPEEADAIAWRLELPPAKQTRLSEFKVAVMLEHEGCDLDHEMIEILRSLANFLASQGAQVSLQARPEIDFDAAHRLFLALYSASASGALPDVYWKVISQMSMFFRKKSNSEIASIIRGYTQRHRDWIRLDLVRTHLRAAWASFFREYDLLLSPTAASPALPHDQSSKIDRFRTIMR